MPNQEPNKDPGRHIIETDFAAVEERCAAMAASAFHKIRESSPIHRPDTYHAWVRAYRYDISFEDWAILHKKGLLPTVPNPMPAQPEE